MAKKKRRKYIRIVRTNSKPGWAFKTELGLIAATFLASFAFLSMRFTGNAVADITSETVSIFGAVLFVLGIIEASLFVMNNKR